MMLILAMSTLAFGAEPAFAPAAYVGGYAVVRDGMDVAFRGEVGLRVFDLGRVETHLVAGALPNHVITVQGAWRYSFGGDLAAEALYTTELLRVGPVLGLHLRGFGQSGIVSRFSLMPYAGVRLDADVVRVGSFAVGLASRWLVDMGRTTFTVDETYVGEAGVVSAQLGLRVSFDPGRRK